jgi:hypothetical protein
MGARLTSSPLARRGRVGDAAAARVAEMSGLATTMAACPRAGNGRNGGAMRTAGAIATQGHEPVMSDRY